MQKLQSYWLMNMKRRYTSRARRSGLSLLELVVSSAMLAVIVTSLSLVLRTARSAWDTAESDYGSLHHAHTIARHFVRQAREAASVSSLASNGRSVTLLLRDGDSVTWTYTAGGTGKYQDAVNVTHSGTGQTSPLAYGIRELNFVGYDANSAITATPQDIQLLEITVTVGIGKGTVTRDVKSSVWVRAW